MPSCRDAQRPFKLIGAHALLGLAKKISAEKPLHQRQVGVVEDCSCHDAKIVVTLEAVVLLTVRYLRRLFVIAARAFGTIAPAQGLKVFAAFGFIAELLNQSAEINGVCHV